LYGLAVKGIKVIFGPEKGPKIGFVLHKNLFSLTRIAQIALCFRGKGNTGHRCQC
jgi:hypothetical protein